MCFCSWDGSTASNYVWIGDVYMVLTDVATNIAVTVVSQSTVDTNERFAYGGDIRRSGFTTWNVITGHQYSLSVFNHNRNNAGLQWWGNVLVRVCITTPLPA